MPYHALDHYDLRVLRLQADVPVDQRIVPGIELCADDAVNAPDLKGHRPPHVYGRGEMVASDDLKPPVGDARHTACHPYGTGQSNPSRPFPSRAGRGEN